MPGFIKMLFSKIWRPLLMVSVLCLSKFTFAQIEITDSHGKYSFEKPPERVVVLNWALAEQMIELGEMPVGFADIAGYKKHTQQNTIDNSVVDVGNRLSPDLRKISELKPEIILIGYSQRSLIRPLSNIATVIYFKNFGKRYNNQDKSASRFLELAKLFDKTHLAQSKLISRDQQLNTLKGNLKTVLDKTGVPSLLFVVPEKSNAAKRSSVLVFGKNSMPFYAAQELGLNVVAVTETDQFGTARLSNEQVDVLLNDSEVEVCIVYMTSYMDSKPEDYQLPSHAQCSLEPGYQNSFGGIMSIQYLAQSIFEPLFKYKETTVLEDARVLE